MEEHDESKANDEDSHNIKGVNAIQSSAFPDNLLQKLLSEHRGDSIICSPLGIHAALTICMCGARGDTLKQMMNVLYTEVEKAKVTPNYAMKINSDLLKISEYYNDTFQGHGKQPVITIANKLWVANNLEILDSYRVSTGVDVVDTYDKAQAQKSAEIVNQWFADNTNNMIKNLVDDRIMSMSDFLITNAIYFCGKFKVAFEERRTQENVPFYSHRTQSQESNQIGTVTMMCSKAKRIFAQKVDGVWDVVKLEYADSSLSLFLVICNQDRDPNDKSLTTADLMKSDRLKAGTAQRRECDLWVPKFNFEAKSNLNSVLENLGMSLPFSVAADFSGIDGSKSLFISKVLHKAVIEVDEQGTKAAAATAVCMDRCRSPPRPPGIRFDRPFEFHIIDETKKMVLFSGRFEGK